MRDLTHDFIRIAEGEDISIHDRIHEPFPRPIYQTISLFSLYDEMVTSLFPCLLFLKEEVATKDDE